jgi:8-oxo-dGTP pyrophosphatase MutT (NUDIX family)
VAERSLSPEEQQPVVRAAGGVVWRRSGPDLEVLLIHRPRYDDWSLPKGKADPGEDDVDTAAREVAEETGLDCVLGSELARIRYTDRNGRPKVVRYWSMTVAGPTPTPFVPNGEVDQLAWLPVTDAGPRLSYPRDRAVLDALVASLTGDTGASGPDAM